jgi:dTDP-4-dehydrorhamnose 3,5-epimerase
VIFRPTSIPGAHLVEDEPVTDERGSFARVFCADELRRAGLSPRVAQSSLSHNRRRGTLRGMHYQVAPAEETKLVRVVSGAIHDVILDLRPASPTYRRWLAHELSADAGRALFVPEGVAHGFVTLTDGAVVLYTMSTPYAPEHARGVRWDDPAFAIEWPVADPIVSDRDRAFPLYLREAPTVRPPAPARAA